MRLIGSTTVGGGKRVGIGEDGSSLPSRLMRVLLGESCLTDRLGVASSRGVDSSGFAYGVGWALGVLGFACGDCSTDELGIASPRRVDSLGFAYGVGWAPGVLGFVAAVVFSSGLDCDLLRFCISSVSTTAFSFSATRAGLAHCFCSRVLGPRMFRPSRDLSPDEDVLAVAVAV